MSASAKTVRIPVKYVACKNYAHYGEHPFRWGAWQVIFRPYPPEIWEKDIGEMPF